METQNIPNVVKPRKLSKAYIATIVVLLVMLACLAVIFAWREAEVQLKILKAQSVINQGQQGVAIRILDDVIADHPNRIKAYELRSHAFASSRSNVYTEQWSYFVYALYDLDKLIELKPNHGEYYVDKDVILREMAPLASDSVTQFAIYDLARMYTEKAIEVGVSPDYSYVYRHHARNLIASNHCEEGLKETEALVAQTSPQDPVMDTYNIYLTEAYLCLQQLDKALEVAQKLQCDDPVATCKSGFLAEIYYQSGDLENALDVVNRMIQTSPAYGGWRYFLRADILYEKGNEDLALQDLATGQNYSWFGNGVYWYVNAKMAFDKGDDENGLLYLQYSESTLGTQYNPLRQKILTELKAREGIPLELKPNITFEVPPIP